MACPAFFLTGVAEFRHQIKLFCKICWKKPGWLKSLTNTKDSIPSPTAAAMCRIAARNFGRDTNLPIFLRRKTVFPVFLFRLIHLNF